MGGTGDKGYVSTGAGGTRSEELTCPRKFQTTLVDVVQTGNAEYAFKLQLGSELRVQPSSDGSGVVLRHEATPIGYLPPQYHIVADCIGAGWTYIASVAEVTGDQKAPHIRVQVVGTPA